MQYETGRTGYDTNAPKDTDNDFLCAGPPTPARGNTPARGVSPSRGERSGSINNYPIPELPPYAVRTPHIHGATAYGAPNSSGGLMMMMMMMICLLYTSDAADE